MKPVHEEETKLLMQSVGGNLRRLRKERKLSLEELAALTGVSKLTLGNIERGDTNPTIGMMWKISKQLEVSLMALLKPGHAVALSRAGEGPRYDSDHPGWTLEPMFSDVREKLEMHRAYVQPHTVYIPETHHAGTMEIVTVMAGSIEVTIGEKTYSLNRFDSIQFSAMESHRYHNAGEDEAVLHLTVCYP